MAKYRISTTKVTTEVFSSAELEADTQEEAEGLAQEMVDDEELSIDSETVDYEHKVEEIG